MAPNPHTISEQTQETPEDAAAASKPRKVTLSFSPEDYMRILKAALVDGSVRLTVKKDPISGREQKCRLPLPGVFLRKIILQSLNGRPQVPTTVTGELQALRLEIRRLGGDIREAVALAKAIKARPVMWGRSAAMGKELQKVWESVEEIESRLERFLTDNG